MCVCVCVCIHKIVFICFRLPCCKIGRRISLAVFSIHVELKRRLATIERRWVHAGMESLSAGRAGLLSITFSAVARRGCPSTRMKYFKKKAPAMEHSICFCFPTANMSRCLASVHPTNHPPWSFSSPETDGSINHRYNYSTDSLWSTGNKRIERSFDWGGTSATSTSRLAFLGGSCRGGG